MSKQETSNAFYEGLKNRGMTHEYLRLQGGSHKWITAMADKVERCSTKVLDGMKADLVFHFNLLDSRWIFILTHFQYFRKSPRI